MSTAGSALGGAASGAATGSVFGPWGAAIGGAIGLVGGLFGGSKAARERKRMERHLNKQETENNAWYNQNALSDYTQRSDSQNLLRNLRENLKRRNKADAGTAVITGATPEAQAAAREQSNQVISDTYAQLGAMGQQYKDQVTDRYLQRKQDIYNQRMALAGNSAQSSENLMYNGLNTMGSALMSIPGLLSARKTPGATTA